MGSQAMRNRLKWIILLFMCTFCNALVVRPTRRLVQRNFRSVIDPFWESGLAFKCTGCGKCCVNEGDVWFNTEEFSDLVYILRIPAEAVLDKFAELVLSGWVKMKDKLLISAQPTSVNAPAKSKCVFLDDAGLKCTMYDSRPVQCRTYPYWPSLLQSEEAWNDAAVLPDTVADIAMNDNDVGNTDSRVASLEKVHSTTTHSRFWTAEDGGCEGINHADAPLVAAPTVHLNQQLYITYHRSFPRELTAQRPVCVEREELLQKVDFIQRTVHTTRQWVQEYVVGHNLCPFARQVQQQDLVQYRVCTETDRSKIIERIKLEVLDLMQQSEEVVATTLLVLPFAFPHFPDFHAFSVDVEDLILPSIEAHNLGSPNHKYVEEPNVQLAFFHPAFEWAAAEDDAAEVTDTDATSAHCSAHSSAQEERAALHFEKRAPFPTINLLRATQVRAAANQAVTSKIALNNAQALVAAGANALGQQLQSFQHRHI